MAVGALWAYRQRLFPVAVTLVALGTLLMILGATAPRLLTAVRRKSIVLAELVGFVTTAVILLVIYFAVMVPVGVLRRAVGADPLRRRSPPSSSYWEPYPARDADHYEKMY